MNELLAYFQRAIEHPETVRPWNDWWIENSAWVQAEFSREDFLRLKYRKLRGARTILERSGWTPTDERRLQPINSGFCNVCGERLFNVVQQTTIEEFIQFGVRSGDEQCKNGFGLHHGLYCPNLCTRILIEYGRDSQEDAIESDSLEPNNPIHRSDEPGPF